MTRTVDAQTATALQQDHVNGLLLLELEFDGGTVRAHSGAGLFSWNGDDFIGVGDHGHVESIQESSQLQSAAINLLLNGVDPARISISLNENFSGRPARLWLAALDDDDQLIGEPVLLFAGSMDTMEGELGDEATITLRLENQLAQWERPKVLRYTDAEQQTLYPGDRGLEFVSQMAEKELVWGPR